ncbi:hypothetical protein B7760_03364 [Burkholderia glumae]|nr:hypothetical protein B7760_03364 [Burkholderia glumae]
MLMRSRISLIQMAATHRNNQGRFHYGRLRQYRAYQFTKNRMWRPSVCTAMSQIGSEVSRYGVVGRRLVL